LKKLILAVASLLKSLKTRLPAPKVGFSDYEFSFFNYFLFFFSFFSAYW